MKRTINFVAAAVLVFGATATFGQNNSPAAPDNVKASVVEKCTITSFDLDFGSYDPLGMHASAPLNGSATIDVTCTKGAPNASVVLDEGVYEAGRQMANGTERLPYELYSDVARTSRWPHTSPGFPVGLAGNETFKQLTIYGQIGAGLLVASGDYVDTVVATVNW